MDLIHLQAPSGAVIGFSLPLHEAIEGQWLRGELQRVTADGAPWEGDQYDVAAVPGDAGTRAGDAADDDAPVRPSGNAPKQSWQAYAAGVGAVTADEAAGMTRAELIAACTPPELLPPDPGT